MSPVVGFVPGYLFNGFLVAVDGVSHSEDLQYSSWRPRRALHVFLSPQSQISDAGSSPARLIAVLTPTTPFTLGPRRLERGRAGEIVLSVALTAAAIAFIAWAAARLHAGLG